MRCVQMKIGDRLYFDEDNRMWIITHDDSSKEGYSTMMMRFAQNVLFIADDSGKISLLKSSLKHHNAKYCYDNMFQFINPNICMGEEEGRYLDEDPNRVFRLKTYYNKLCASE